jgi:ribosome-binding factor A
VQELLVQYISEILRREMKDPRIGFVTITDAEVTPDLRHSRIYFSVLGTAEEQEETGKALNRASGFIRAEFAKRAQLRYVPDIRFDYDSSVERSARLNILLEQVRREQVSEDESRDKTAAEASGDSPAERE